MTTLLDSADIIFKDCFKLKSNESVLIVTDDNKADIAQVFLEKARALVKDATMISMKELSVNGEEPPVSIAGAMSCSDVVLCITSKSMTHTKATKSAIMAGARVASMPGITKEMLTRTIDVDYSKMRANAQK